MEILLSNYMLLLSVVMRLLLLLLLLLLNRYEFFVFEVQLLKLKKDSILHTNCMLECIKLRENNFKYLKLKKIHWNLKIFWLQHTIFYEEYKISFPKSHKKIKNKNSLQILFVIRDMSHTSQQNLSRKTFITLVLIILFVVRKHFY